MKHSSHFGFVLTEMLENEKLIKLERTQFTFSVFIQKYFTTQISSSSSSSKLRAMHEMIKTFKFRCQGSEFDTFLVTYKSFYV